MSEPRVWAVSEDGKIQYLSLTPGFLNDAVILLRESFFAHENVCKAIGLADNPRAIAECDEFVLTVAKQGVSVIAVEKESQKVVGVSLNQIQHKTESSKDFNDDYIKKLKFPETKAIFQFLIEIEDIFDPFALYDVDCLMELLFLGVNPEYGGRGIGLKLFEVSIDLANLLYKGENVKTSFDGSIPSIDPKPQIVSSILTTFKTQRMCRRLNFDLVKTMKFKDVFHNGESYASRLGDEDMCFTLECKRLE